MSLKGADDESSTLMPEDEKVPCAACGFLTKGRPFYGTYDICPVCGWEDDGVQLANPTSGGGANRESLAAAQDAALGRWPPGREACGAYRRGGRWRPLTAAERSRYDDARGTALWVHRAVVEEAEAYWMRGRPPG
jgi:hypothetical protein